MSTLDEGRRELNEVGQTLETLWFSQVSAIADKPDSLLKSTLLAKKIMVC